MFDHYLELWRFYRHFDCLYTSSTPVRVPDRLHRSRPMTHRPAEDRHHANKVLVQPSLRQGEWMGGCFLVTPFPHPLISSSGL